MNVLVSVGITKCRNESVSAIPCAKTDAETVYKTFKEVLEDEFSDYHSICLTDSNLSEFMATINMLGRNLKKEDKLIIYFSGHGQLANQDRLHLLFKDAESTGTEGRLSIPVLKDLLTNTNFQTILILDCCHAGAALSIANRTNIFTNDKISIIASSNAWDRAKFDESGSLFTKSFCKVLSNLNENGKPISLNSIAEDIRNFGDPCYINIQHDVINVVLKENNTVLIEDNRDFEKRFLMRINESDTATREMHWYYLMDLPEMTKLQVLSAYLFEIYPSEPHWLVRRAIGSLINGIKVNNHKETIILNLLQSRNWMSQCIGLIGGRKELGNEKIREAFYTVFANNAQIDAVWLANLYLTDSKYYDIDFALSTALTQTPWGILDIWVRYSKGINKQALKEKIENTVTNKSLLEPLYVHMFFEDGYQEDKVIESLSKVKCSELIPYMYDLKKRGETKSAKLKWLFSSLYGNWRDQLDLKLHDYFANHGRQKINIELEMAAYLPFAEMRMAIFQYMVIYNELLEEHFNSLKWGLSDPHPWVKRTAIRVFINHQDLLKEAFTEKIDGKLYPGKLDFILEAISLGIDCEEYVDSLDLTANETNSLNWAKNNILKEKRILI